MVKKLRITVEGKVYDVVVEDVTEDAGSQMYPQLGMSQAAAVRSMAAAPAAAPAKPAAAAASANDITAPLGGVMVEVNVKNGDGVTAGDQVAVIEAMKMKTAVISDHAGTVSNLMVKVGDAVDGGQPLMTIS